jgi:hypothetical protein
MIGDVHWRPVLMKQWQQPQGQLHSEQRIRQPVDVLQQYHSPRVMHPLPQPPPPAQVRHGQAVPLQFGAGE